MGKMRGYPGHEEIELALIRLYRITGDERQLALAEYFVEERGPEAQLLRSRGPGARGIARGLPLRPDPPPGPRAFLEQTEAKGHAVRALYLYAAMADLARETGDGKWMRPLRKLWEDVTVRKMFVTGGVGSSPANEGFTVPYDLPEHGAYAETCAAIALVFWAHRMLQGERDGRYADIMERALYNGVISGVSLDGARFFYANPMAREALDAEHAGDPDIWDGETYGRRDWFGCACCPPTSPACWRASGDTSTPREAGGSGRTSMPGVGPSSRWEIGPSASPRRRTIPGTAGSGSPWIRRKRPPSISPAHPRLVPVAQAQGKWAFGGAPSHPPAGLRPDPPALERRRRGRARAAHARRAGPGPSLGAGRPGEGGPPARPRGLLRRAGRSQPGPGGAHRLPRDSVFRVVMKKRLLGGVAVLKGNGLLRDDRTFRGKLYRVGPPRTRKVSVTAIPYSLWDNREPGVDAPLVARGLMPEPVRSRLGRHRYGNGSGAGSSEQGS